MSKRLDFISLRIKTWYIFQRNFEDLCAACNDFEKPENIFEENGQKITMSMNANFEKQEIERKFHNFLASAKTLVDHTRSLMEEYQVYDIEGVFLRKIEELKNIPVVKFCHDLRNHFVHSENPIDNLYVSGLWYEDENHIVYKYYVRMSVKNLMECKNLTKQSRKYLEGAGEKIELKNLAEEYYFNVLDVNVWLNNCFPILIPND